MAGDEKAAVDAADRESKHDALRTIAILPGIMFLVYLGLILYFRSRGGYKPVVLDLKINGDIPHFLAKGDAPQWRPIES